MTDLKTMLVNLVTKTGKAEEIKPEATANIKRIAEEAKKTAATYSGKKA